MGESVLDESSLDKSALGESALDFESALGERLAINEVAAMPPLLNGLQVSDGATH